MEIIKYSTKTLVKQTAKILGNFVEKNKNQNILLIISGGSALQVLDKFDTSLLSKNITISVVDERFSMDNTVNNFSQIENTNFFDECLKKECAVIGTRIHKGETLPRAMMNFNSQIQKWRDAHLEGVVIALLGIGEDGHTSGVMPFPESKRLFEDLFLDQEWIASYDAMEKHEHPLRFTTTLTFLKDQVEHAVVFVSGDNKKQALDKINNEKLELHDVPAKIFLEMKDVTICTDIDTSV